VNGWWRLWFLLWARQAAAISLPRFIVASKFSLNPGNLHGLTVLFCLPNHGDGVYRKRGCSARELRRTHQVVSHERGWCGYAQRVEVRAGIVCRFEPSVG